jgi:hypothetical protein
VSFRDALVHRLRKQSVSGMARLACWIALVGLAVMVSSIIYPAPLLIIFAMSGGQVIGIVAFLCYLLSVLMDVVRGADHAPDDAGPARKFRAPDAEKSGDSA